MNQLELFLQALSRIVHNNKETFIPHLKITPSKFGAIKEYKVDIWSVDENNKKLISSCSRIENVPTDKTKLEALNNIMIDSIEQILRHYGVQ